MKYLLFILCFFCFINETLSQKETSIWYFGYEAGVDFNSGSPVALTDGKLSSSEGCSTVSDKNGNLLFYTDGSTVWNRNHAVMQNGTGLLGHNSSTQSGIIIPKPGSPFIYYIFTADEPNPVNADDNLLNDEGDGSNDGLNYSEVNMMLDGGLGGINPSKKNIQLITYNTSNPEESALKCSEKISAVQHSDGNSYWVLAHFINNFYAFKIDYSGVNTEPVKTTVATSISIGGYFPNAIGYLKISPNGKKIGIAHLATRITNERGPKGGIVRNSGIVMLYDFSSSTGIVSNGITLLSNVNPYGLEFSSKSTKLYTTINNFNSDNITEGSSLFQFDLESSNIIQSKILIQKSDYVAGALQLAIDEKIYRSGYPIFANGGEYLSVIHNPEQAGTSCNYEQNNVHLNGKKVRLGLPPFIQSLFLFTFNYEFTCFGDATHFYIDSDDVIDNVIWDFGDGSSSNDLDTNHIYVSPGIYTVSLTRIVNGENKEPIVKDVIIHDIPEILTEPFELVQCDILDSSSTDGIANFNLSNANNPITFNKGDKYDVFYYLDDISAQNDEFNQYALDPIYRNIVPDQIISAKIIDLNSGCYSYGKVKLTAIPFVDILPENEGSCDIGEDGTATFDFDIISSNIISKLNLPSTVMLNYYETEENAAYNIDPLPRQFISYATMVYIKAENQGICYGAGSIYLEVYDFPSIDFQEENAVCKSLFPIQIEVGVDPNMQNDYSYYWSSGETSHEIFISDSGTYTVNITDNNNGCSRFKTITISKVDIPEFQNIDIQPNSIGSSITIKMILEDAENEYALDNPYSMYQIEPNFDNVAPGIHMIYVMDKYRCGVASKEVFILGFPKYFTPNNDGQNDTWKVLGVNQDKYIISDIIIYNRYGKLLAIINPDGGGWNGLYNNEFLPSNDYWFTLDVTDNENVTKNYKGHFSLIRR